MSCMAYFLAMLPNNEYLESHAHCQIHLQKKVSKYGGSYGASKTHFRLPTSYIFFTEQQKQYHLNFRRYDGWGLQMQWYDSMKLLQEGQPQPS